MVLTCGFITYSQKVKFELKKDTVWVETSPYFTMDKISTGAGWFDFSLKEMSGREFAYVRTLSYVNYSHPEASKNNGNVYYFDFRFFDFDLTCEVRCMPPVLAKGVAKLVVQNHLIKDGKADEAAIKRFCQIHGTRYTDDQRRIGIIIHR